jgi:hypothetical protein
MLPFNKKKKLPAFANKKIFKNKKFCFVSFSEFCFSLGIHFLYYCCCFSLMPLLHASKW